MIPSENHRWFSPIAWQSRTCSDRPLCNCMNQDTPESRPCLQYFVDRTMRTWLGFECLVLEQDRARPYPPFLPQSGIVHLRAKSLLQVCLGPQMRWMLCPCSQQGQWSATSWKWPWTARREDLCRIRPPTYTFDCLPHNWTTLASQKRPIWGSSRTQDSFSFISLASHRRDLQSNAFLTYFQIINNMC